MLGYLDDLLIVPVGIAIAVRLVPAALMVEFRHEAGLREGARRSFSAAIVIVIIWLLALAGAAYWLLRKNG